VQFVGNYVGNYHVVLHTGANLTGELFHASRNEDDLGGHRNRIRSIEIYQLSTNCEPIALQVAIFTETFYKTGSCRVLNVGSYRSPDDIGIPNDSMSSVRVGSMVQVRVCEHADLQGCTGFLRGDSPEAQ